MILSIDTSDSAKTIVGLKNKKEIVTISESSKITKSQNLLYLIDRILKQKKLSIADVTSISVNSGPGSFTGLRVGASVANTLGFSQSIPVNNKNTPAEPVYSKSKFDY